MKYCSHCSKEFKRDDYTVCPVCGGPLAHVEHHVCPNCKRILPANDLITCPYCITPLYFDESNKAYRKAKIKSMEDAQRRHNEVLEKQLVSTPRRPRGVRRVAHLLVLALAFLLLAVTLLPIIDISNGDTVYKMSMFSALLNEFNTMMKTIKEGANAFQFESYYLLDVILAGLFLWNAIKFLILFFNLLAQCRHKDEWDCKKDATRNIFHAVLGILHAILVVAFVVIAPEKILNAEVKANYTALYYYAAIIGGVSILLLLFGILSHHTRTIRMTQKEVYAYHRKHHVVSGLFTFVIALGIIAGAAGCSYYFYKTYQKTTSSPTIVSTDTTTAE